MNTIDITIELPRLLSAVDRPGDFYGTGEVETPLVRIAVDGVGVLGLPIPPTQAQELARLATPAPYGRGGDTLLDPTVRRCGQIASSSVHADDPRWRGVLDSVLAAACSSLGVAGDVEAHLYKMLVYEPGGFFVGHRDTEKEPGMFGTLVVVLPSEHSGGDLVVTHGGKQARLGLGADFGYIRWAAFYADCTHEVLPVEAGWRVALVYNLVRTAGPLPEPPDHGPHVRAVAAALRRWEADPDRPSKLVLPLAHYYTPAELSFGALKNGDAAITAVLLRAAASVGHVVRLAMISIWESGSAAETWDHRGRWDFEPDPDDFEVLEVYERTENVEGWVTPDGEPDHRGPLPLEEDELCPPGSLDDAMPDDQEYHEATGNAGATFERTYRHAALVVWPASAELELVLQGGLEGALRVLRQLIADGDLPTATRLAGMLVDSWPPAVRHTRAEARASMLGALVDLGARDLLAQFLDEVVTAGAYEGEERAAVLLALAMFEEDDADRRLARLVTRRARRLLPVAQLVREACTQRPAPKALEALIAAVEAVVPAEEWRAREEEADRRGALVEVIQASAAANDTRLARRLTAAVLTSREEWDLDRVVIPALLLTGGARAADGLRAACVAHLEERIALPLDPPANASRATEGLTCRCAHCNAARAFLSHPKRTALDVKENTAIRDHLRSALEAARSDVECTLIRQGRPYTLRLTKTQASHERRVAQRRDDQEKRAELTRQSQPPTAADGDR